MLQTIETIALIWVVLVIAYGTIALALPPCHMDDTAA
jgi:hypothetical protein